MSAELVWFKSSYSNNEGGACLEVSYDWRKSSYSGNEDSYCVEVGAHPHAVHVRDSEIPDGPVFTVAPAAWTTFVGRLQG
ncbi:DUF397 domain-containing protein [Streptomyces sp. NBC_01387]|uniref:DUF397 domain-containing protein n=1 Tax=unclassified Streptomyces TaxID=2593676 RepID=UPI002DDAA526|nr:DUF397 domain-containing protein [Streptomyces sp. NBC_01766]WSC21738.1 DUF397 domain-containing protein [Streptomyces sp. NBC_01766]